jgi:hypothetical protein
MNVIRLCTNIWEIKKIILFGYGEMYYLGTNNVISNYCCRIMIRHKTTIQRVLQS